MPPPIRKAENLFGPFEIIVLLEGENPPPMWTPPPPIRNFGGQMASQRFHIKGGGNGQSGEIAFQYKKSSIFTYLGVIWFCKLKHERCTFESFVRREDEQRETFVRSEDMPYTSKCGNNVIRHVWVRRAKGSLNIVALINLPRGCEARVVPVRIRRHLICVSQKNGWLKIRLPHSTGWNKLSFEPKKFIPVVCCPPPQPNFQNNRGELTLRQWPW